MTVAVDSAVDVVEAEIILVCRSFDQVTLLC